MNNQHPLDNFNGNDPGFDVEQLRQNTLFLRRALSESLDEAARYKTLYSRLLADYGHQALTPFGQNALEKIEAENAALKKHLNTTQMELYSVRYELENKAPGTIHLNNLIGELTYNHHLNTVSVVLEQRNKEREGNIFQAEK